MTLLTLITQVRQCHNCYLWAQYSTTLPFTDWNNYPFCSPTVTLRDMLRRCRECTYQRVRYLKLKTEVKEKWLSKIYGDDVLQYWLQDGLIDSKYLFSAVEFVFLAETFSTLQVWTKLKVIFNRMSTYCAFVNITEFLNYFITLLESTLLTHTRPHCFNSLRSQTLHYLKLSLL